MSFGYDQQQLGPTGLWQARRAEKHSESAVPVAETS